MAKKDEQYLSGKLLIATPGMEDTRFHRAVILLCAHDEGGAMGLVINQALPSVEFNDLVKQLKLESDIKVNFESMKLPVMYGGPVEAARGFLLHTGEFSRPETLNVDDAYGITGTIDALKDIAQGDGPSDLMFVLGYAGWDAGQLETELVQNAWLVVDSDKELIFSHDHKQKWTQAVNKLGFDPAMLSVEAGRA